MKSEKKELKITEISWEDFQKLNLKGFQHRTHHYMKDANSDKEVLLSENDPHGEFVVDSRGGKHWVSYSDVYSRVDWDEVSLNDIVSENIEFSKEEGWTNPICVAIHEEITEEEVADELKMFARREDNEKQYQDYKTRTLLAASSYLDKFLTRAGMQTYLIRCDVQHLYSRRNYFYTKDDYFQIDKRETKAVYLIHWN